MPFKKYVMTVIRIYDLKKRVTEVNILNLPAKGFYRFTNEMKWK